MPYESLETLATSKNWSALEREWLTAIEQADTDPSRLLPIIDIVVEAGESSLAETLGWIWLTTAKETQTPNEALRLGQDLIMRLPDGEELREEVLSLCRQMHADRPDLEAWIDRSGLLSGKSVRRALRFLTTGLRLTVGTYLVHRTEDVAAQLAALDLSEDLATIKTPRRSQNLEIARLIEDYNVAEDNDFRVLRQLRPERLRELVEQDPIALVIGILRCRDHAIDRDELKLMLVPQHLPARTWSDWWTKVRNGVKRCPHLRIEGRSPMFLVYSKAGQSLETEAWSAFSRAKTPREWLDLLEGYLRDTGLQKVQPDAAFLNRVQTALVEHVERLTRHKEPAGAFATALVIERLAADGLPVSTDAHGLALEMLKRADDPVAVVASVADTRLWPLAVGCVEQAFPEGCAELFSELILYAPAGHCDALARRVEQLDRGELLPSIVQRATADPGRFTDAMMWVWKGPDTKAEVPIPPLLETLNIILGLVGPERISGGKIAGQTAGQMRAKVRAGLASKSYAKFRACIEALDPAMAQTIRRQVERAEGLGPRSQEELLNIVRAKFPQLYVKAKVAMWDDESVLYFTEAGLRARETELHELVNVKMRENAKAIGEAAARGDLSENAEYKFALEERDLLRARLARINAEVSLARVLGPQDVPHDHVGIGQHVTLQPKAGGEPVVVTILGANDSDIAGLVFSYQTPIAGQLLGKRPGDVVTMTLGGPEAEFEIKRIENAIA